MTSSPTRPHSVHAVALEVLPNFGIAYFVDEHDAHWAVTKSTPGQGLHGLQPGQRVQLTLKHADDITLVSAYQALD